jgi:hypothetical protein
MSNTAAYSLRDLPLPAKLVITVFLLAVGLGYFSALVQLHLQHSSRDGQPMPSPDDVVERFSGLKRFDGKKPVSRLENVLSGPKDGGFDKNNMTRAFFDKASDYAKECKDRTKEIVDAERDLERLLVIAWGNSPTADKKKTYDSNAFPIPENLLGKPITEDMTDEGKKQFKIKDAIEVRCAFCHNEGDKKPALDNWVNIEELALVPEMKVIDGKWIKSTKQLSVEGLTQSTHAHALSFAMLFSLTGIVFAFSSYPGWFRCLLAPIVLTAQVVDLACWWLARLEGIGPYFALAIMVNGGIVGLGLSLQILLSLFNLYGWKGKLFPLVLVLLHGAGLGIVVKEAILPALEAEKKPAAIVEPMKEPASKKEAPAKEEPKKEKEEEKKPEGKAIPEVKD